MCYNYYKFSNNSLSNRKQEFMSDNIKKLLDCYRSVREKTDFIPKIALVLGSGLGAYADQIRIVQEIPYQEIKGFPVSTVPGHEGKFVFGWLGEVPMVCMKGRIHYYEGYQMSDIVLPVRLMKLMGAEILFLTNAAGGVNESFVPGDLMMITDHISCFVPNPLIGPNEEQVGVRFPDMSSVYDADLCSIIRNASEKLGIGMKEGVYLQLTGPSYETPAEIRMIRTLGADAVGMSTAIEAVTARHAGMKVCGISCISNLAAGMSGKPLNHEEVQETADRVSANITKLVTESILQMGRTMHGAK